MITRRQSQPGSLQYNSMKPYSPSGRAGCWVTMTDLVSRAPSSGNLSIKGIIGMNPPPGVEVILADFTAEPGGFCAQAAARLLSRLNQVPAGSLCSPGNPRFLRRQYVFPVRATPP